MSVFQIGSCAGDINVFCVSVQTRCLATTTSSCVQTTAASGSPSTAMATMIVATAQTNHRHVVCMHRPSRDQLFGRGYPGISLKYCRRENPSGVQLNAVME